MRVLVTGANGFIGKHLLATLRRDGKEALALARSPAVDGYSERANRTVWPAGGDAVVHLAAAIPRETKLSEPELLRANVEATHGLAKLAREQGIKRIIFVSTASVHGSGGERPYRESDPLDPPNAYARSKKLAEEAFWDALGPDRALGTVIRPTPVFGEGGHGPVAALVKLARLPAPLPLKGIGGLRSIVSVDSLADIIAMCLNSDTARGDTVFAADDAPLRAEDIVRSLRAGWKRGPLMFRAPGGLLGTAARFAGAGASWDSMTRPFVVDTGHLRQILGWHSPVTSSEKLRQLAAAGKI